MSTVVKSNLGYLVLELNELDWPSFTKFPLQLGVKNHVLQQYQHQDISERKRAVLQHWLDNDLNACWEKVVHCLEMAKQKVLADDMKKKYCTEAAVETTTLLKSG